MVVESDVSVIPLETVYASGGERRCTCRDGIHCESPGKHPLTSHGLADATTDLAMLRRWASRWPGCNWGAVPPIGVVVFDLDPRNGGYATMSALELQHGPLPLTLSASTGGGGLHLWLTCPEVNRGKLGKGIDVKSHRGYVVLPPSKHVSGGTYSWLDLRDAAAIPQWAYDLLNPPARHPMQSTPHRSLDGLVSWLSKQTENRNNALFWAACRAAEAGGDLEALRPTAISIGLTPPEVEKTIASAVRTYSGAA